MPDIVLRPPALSELPVLSDLCLRSKGYWGYDTAFLEACREELTLRADDLSQGAIIVAEIEGQLTGISQIAFEDETADLLKFFVDPDFIGSGVGRKLFAWTKDTAKQQGAEVLTIEADPDAAPFYQKMGAVLVGTAPSCSIPGRKLPLLELRL